MEFSVNKNIFVENLYEKFLVAQRQVYDTIKHLGGVTELALNNKIKKCVQNTYKSYMEFLKREKQKSKEIDRLKLEKKNESKIYNLEIKKKETESGNVLS